MLCVRGRGRDYAGFVCGRSGIGFAGGGGAGVVGVRESDGAGGVEGGGVDEGLAVLAEGDGVRVAGEDGAGEGVAKEIARGRILITLACIIQVSKLT